MTPCRANAAASRGPQVPPGSATPAETRSASATRSARPSGCHRGSTARNSSVIVAARSASGTVVTATSTVASPNHSASSSSSPRTVSTRRSGPVGTQPLDRGGHQDTQGAGDGTDPHPGGLAGPSQVLDRGQPGQHGPGVLGDLAAERGRHGTVLATLERPPAQPPLQGGDRPADRGLGALHKRRCNSGLKPPVSSRDLAM
ncbi:hypothetical protein [Amycolatopsis suaedae]|uniref:hypothetical protein n=1 Tax=Amycolatopsis suaedae TaxID=2510978 RepID=UPI00196AFDD7|nr:hypothetical protein [Amycolatopsis suaedae]